MFDLIQSIPPWFYLAIIIPMMVLLPTVGVLTLLERKVASWAQDRIGPNRAETGFGLLPEGHPLRFRFPLLQVAADGLKFFAKEDYRAKNVDKILFSLAPALMIVIVMVAVAIIPWGGTYGGISTINVPKGESALQAIQADLAANHRHHLLVGTPNLVQPTAEQLGDSYIPGKPLTLAEPAPVDTTVTYSHGWRLQIASLDIGVLFALSILSLAVYGVVIGGWASNNKYSFLGGLRATANMISYEIPIGLSVLAVAVLFSTFDLEQIVERQTHYWLGFIPAWNIFAMPSVAILFLICLHAESNRAPFDTAEAEQELVGGYHTEYSSMRFALFFLSEYFEMLVTSSILVALFLGGWHLPWVDLVVPQLAGGLDKANPSLTSSWWVLPVHFFVFFGKVLFIIFVFMWTRWSLPRFKFDQILTLAWKGVIPMSLGLVALSALTLWAMGGTPREYNNLPFGMALVLLAGNVIIFFAATAIGAFASGNYKDKPNKRILIPGSRFTHSPVPPALPSSLPAAH